MVLPMNGRSSKEPISRTASPNPPTFKRRALKSRLGCRTCKFRKVKCDEVRPLCGNCARRSLFIDKCDFEFDLPNPPPSARNAAKKGKSDSPLMHSQVGLTISQPLTFRPILSREPPAVVEFETRLMKHFTDAACVDLPDSQDPRLKEIWEATIPRIAHQVDFAHSITLAISAQHYHFRVPEDPHLAPASDYYFARAVSQYRNALSHIGVENAEPLLITSIMLAHHTWIDAFEKAAEGNYWPALQSFYLSQGVQSLYYNVAPFLNTEQYSWFYTDDRIVIIDELVAHRLFWQSCKADLQQILDEAHNRCPDTGLIYANTIVHLKAVYFAMLTKKSPFCVQREIATLILKIPREYADLVMEQDPPALALAARYFALLRVVDHTWWLHGKRGREISEGLVQVIGDFLPVEWQWSMEWPLHFMSGFITPEI